MMLTDHAREQTEEIGESLVANLRFIEAVWDAFAPKAQWPRAAELTRALFGSGVRIDTEQLAWSMPNELVVLDRSVGTIRLHVRALAAIESAGPLCDLYVLVIRHLVGEYGRPGPDPAIVSSEFESVLAIGGDAAARLEELCLAEGWGLLAQGGEPGGIRFALDIAVALRLADVETVDDYLAAQANAFWPDPEETLRRMVASTQTTGAVDRPRATKPAGPAPELHPIISGAANDLLAGGHLREAVDRAALALQDAVAERAELPGLTGDPLMAQAFSPKGGRLVVGDLGTLTGQNLQRGTHLVALGAIAAIRNPASHALVDPSLAEAMEQLAILSFVARQLDRATLRNGEPDSV